MTCTGSATVGRCFYQVAFDRLRCPHKELAVVAGADALFGAPGSLDEAVDRSLHWFSKFLLTRS